MKKIASIFFPSPSSSVFITTFNPPMCFSSAFILACYGMLVGVLDDDNDFVILCEVVLCCIVFVGIWS